jgi:hypothetical protein
MKFGFVHIALDFDRGNGMWRQTVASHVRVPGILSSFAIFKSLSPLVQAGVDIVDRCLPVFLLDHPG